MESNNGKYSVDRESSVTVDLSTKAKLVPMSFVERNLSLFELYSRERDACRKYRMIFTVNPVCTNILFNMRTEVTRFEGSASATVITDTQSINPTYYSDNIQNVTPVNRMQAIRDTEYSNENNGDFEYHCGIDIFNNHMLRRNGFTHVNKINPNDQAASESRLSYNTISDVLRDGEGLSVKRNISTRYDMSDNTVMHVYTQDNTKTFKASYDQGLKEEDGWLGFTNPASIDIPNNSGKTVNINRMLCGEDTCSFVDMYPTRDLFSFIPKYNKYRGRSERNWDYCITYPYAVDYNLVDVICGGKCQTMSAKATVAVNTSSVQVLQCVSKFRHTLAAGDMVSVYYYTEEDGNFVFKKYPKAVRVVSIGYADGSYEDEVFSVRFDDIKSMSDDLLTNGFYYKKIVSGCECRYYFKVNKKLLGYDGDMERTEELMSDHGAMSYAENIYGDGVARIVFTDDIDVQGLVDHLGRPLSQVSLTFVKRHAGSDEWYEDKDYASDTVEFSHCFGKVTSGVRYSSQYEEDDFMDFNVLKLHNIDASELEDVSPVTLAVLGDSIIDGMPLTIEDDVTSESEDYYASMVEFDGYDYTETELSPVFHRFNTVQREYVGTGEYGDINYDFIRHDDYDLDENGDHVPFQVDEMDYAVIKAGGEQLKVLGNLRPEGYYYNPHTNIQLREESDTVTRISAVTVNYTSPEGHYDQDTDRTTVRLKFPTNYGFKKHSMLSFYDVGVVNSDGTSEPPRLLWFSVESITGSTMELVCDGNPFGVTSDEDFEALVFPTGQPKRYILYYSSYGIPLYAVFEPGIKSYVWRGLLNMSELDETSPLYDMPFSNGRSYIERRVTFPVRRQDPDGLYGLSKALNPLYQNPMESFEIEPGRFDYSQALEFYDKVNNLCW